MFVYYDSRLITTIAHAVLMEITGDLPLQSTFKEESLVHVSSQKSPMSAMPEDTGHC